VVPLHVAPRLFVASQVTPHALQLFTVFVGVSQPPVFGAAVLQFANPVTQPV
jgi:hypothetical protein